MWSLATVRAENGGARPGKRRGFKHNLQFTLPARSVLYVTMFFAQRHGRVAIWCELLRMDGMASTLAYS
eukprot:11221745-Lingulodinium_polyedra.AAC.1